MSTEIQRFDFKGAALRTLTDEAGEPWFVAKDVCDILGIDTNHLGESLDSDEMNTLRITEGNTRGNPNKTIISEPGLYRLVMRSRKPEAKEFQRWVTHEVLPSIRRHGAYMTESTLEKAVTEPDFLIRLATQIKQERAEKEKAQAQVERMRPKALFADAVETSKTSILVGDLAKVLKGNGVDIGGTRLFAWLRDNGWLMKTGSSRNMPTQKSMELGLFEIKETTVVHSDGHTTINKTPKVTGKGQTFFVNKFLGHREITQ
ncbi:phage antirepressor Ant [Bifidobacterium longum]|uniref:Phage antirepressor protein KilAC domain protein n=2 Tax=Bifidobacterium longum subsp. infantis TaxID=1682 RepID=A0ABP1XCU9_BIFLI|nr:phage antirepressor Ant [Bifidobacterium longum]ACJ52608.1 phage antirepressor protein [Bifidobacterium longum subsp. infantis ATCC 15697 = JCM 1222 = DSM 20088]MBX4249531.1 phage antirepressor Ant [Bifidobacterium longum subsp. infantis]MEE4090314.1 phage antirepressor Ant [Bifidobacterium longum subsp. infantis]CEE99105.1 Phage antirepressor protein KilAC domain protein [Bifidobacterium longum subsp. infantis]CEF01781.1 Phage antirepressor protein KilAC domain protein [Bifidobacterium lon